MPSLRYKLYVKTLTHVPMELKFDDLRPRLLLQEQRLHLLDIDDPRVAHPTLVIESLPLCLWPPTLTTVITMVGEDGVVDATIKTMEAVVVTIPKIIIIEISKIKLRIKHLNLCCTIRPQVHAWIVRFIHVLILGIKYVLIIFL